MKKGTENGKLIDYVLDDGSVWTTKSLMKEIGCAHGTAYARLTKSNEASYVLRKKEFSKKYGGLRLYVLDDGSEWTSRMVAKHTGCKLSTASTRLSCYTDPEKVLKPPLTYDYKDKTVNEYTRNRMYFDTNGHWALINKFT